MGRIKKLCSLMFLVAVLGAPATAFAGNIVDNLNLAPFVPMVLDSLMMVATGGYEFFVGDGTGIIYFLVWTFLGASITLGLVKMYFPKSVLGFFGISGGGEMENGVDPKGIIYDVVRSGVRAVIAAAVLLQLRPVLLTQLLVNPFLQLGAAYTHAITETINEAGVHAPEIKCPPEIVEKAWISESSCEFLVQPVADLSHANNRIVTRGFDFLTRGLRGLITMVPHGGEDFLNLVTGILLIITFVASNVFMALLVIQGIFNFGMQLILYPFYVLTYVFKKSDKWFDVWPAFSGITKALQQLIVTMIACAFMLCINLAIIKALFQWGTSVFVAATGGSATSNVPTIPNSPMGFGEHSIMWLSAILTFYLMLKIFDMTQQQLNKYVGSGMNDLYDKVSSDAKTMWNKAKGMGAFFGKVMGNK